jgi:asparagine synthase (glutamine-hydrolysing)
MCGIAGIIHPSASRPLIEAMTEVMISRGPDGAGYHVEPGVAMGMRRLSIIDLAHGWQPLYSGERSVVAFQNGEIYNFQELRKQLQAKGYVFQTDSDTEVLAHGYHAWGIEDLANRLDGMYAIAILDRSQRALFLVRDRFGEKPLFIAQFAGGFAYASDMRILAALPEVGTEISMDGLNDYLALHYVPGRHTILAKVARVLPGEIVRIPLDAQVPSFSTYYRPPIGSQRPISDNELADLIESAVGSRLIADVPVGVFLSGGLDSSIVAAIAARRQSGIATFSMGFRSAEHDESEYAKLLASHIGSDHHHFVFDEQNFSALLPQVARSLDEPIGDQALLPVYWLCQEASRHVKVVLAGEGADEVFAGYGYYSQFSSAPTIKDYVRTLFRGRGLSPAATRLIRNPNPATPSGFPLLTDVAGREVLIGPLGVTPDAWEEGVLRWLDGASDPLQRATCADLVTWLPDDLLVKFDRMAMAHSLEGRAPFLDPRVVEAGTVGLRSSDRMRGSASKIALRRVARRWLPESIFERRKQGFVLPMKDWIATWANERGDVAAYFSDIPGYGTTFHALGVSIADSIVNDPARERFHFAAIMLCEWARSFIGQVNDIAHSLSKHLETENTKAAR